jgi:thioesterase domain-containing protein
MMNTTQAISELQKFLSFKRAGEHAEDVLKKLQDAEGETKEQTAKAEKLKAENAALLDEAAKAKAKIKAADDKAADIIGAANAKAETAIENALKSINDMQDKASAKLLETNDRVTVAERKAIVAEGLAKESEAKLAELTAAVDKQKAALKKLIGE